MSDKDVAGQGPEKQEPGTPAPETPGGGHPGSRDPFIASGPASTRDLRERARRRRDAEGKLQQQLLNAREKRAQE